VSLKIAKGLRMMRPRKLSGSWAVRTVLEYHPKFTGVLLPAFTEGSRRNGVFWRTKGEAFVDSGAGWLRGRFPFFLSPITPSKT
jgi:hypothetical protein